MKLLVRNKIFALLSLSRFLNTLGAAIYNLVFVVFAASMPQPSLAVGIANLIVFIPSLFTVFVGMKADRTKKKLTGWSALAIFKPSSSSLLLSWPRFRVT